MHTWKTEGNQTMSQQKSQLNENEVSKKGNKQQKSCRIYGKQISKWQSPSPSIFTLNVHGLSFSIQDLNLKNGFKKWDPTVCQRLSLDPRAPLA